MEGENEENELFFYFFFFFIFMRWAGDSETQRPGRDSETGTKTGSKEPKKPQKQQQKKTLQSQDQEAEDAPFTERSPGTDGPASLGRSLGQTVVAALLNAEVVVVSPSPLVVD